jgi:PGF-pre-PGF domain-containing protein
MQRNRRCFNLFIAIAILLVVPIFILSTAVTATNIDSQVLEELNDNGQARVIVILDDSEDLQDAESLILSEDISEVKEKIENEQEKILDKLELKNNTLELSGPNSLGEEDLEFEFDLKHQYELINGFSGNVTKEGLKKLKRLNVESIEIDHQFHINLDESVPFHNADDVWQISVNGKNLDGDGQTVCVIDTGVNYGHEALGNCAFTSITFDGEIENLTTPVESDHDYANNADVNFTITMPGYTSIAVHFVNISLEHHGASDTSDRVIVLDGNNATVAVYKEDLLDVWSPSVEGDTINIKLQTDPSITDYGFYIDAVINGTTNTTANYSSCSRFYGGWDFVNIDNDPWDDQSHGTHVAGIVLSNDSTYPGVAPGAGLIAMKALNSGGSGYSSDIAAAIDWCTANKEKFNVSVISMSIGTSDYYNSGSCDGYSSLLTTASNAAKAAGIFVVASSGNEGRTTGVSAPACISSVVSVGSVSSLDSVSSFSNSGPNLDILARGTSITSAGISSSTSYVSKSGTSMAAPHVSGAAALLIQYWELAYDKIISPDQILRKLSITGVLVNDSKNGIIRPSFDILEAIKPYINYTEASITNGSNITSRIANINITSDVPLSNAFLEWTYPNNTKINYSMTSYNTTLFGYTITNLSAGLHSYSVFANDSADTFGQSSLRTLFNDHLSPENVNIIVPQENKTYGSELITFNASINDSNSNIDVVIFNISGEGDYLLFATNLGGYWTYSVNFSTFADGNYTLQIIANDSLGNINNTVFTNFIVDSNNPEIIEIISPINGANFSEGLVVFNVSVNDSLSGVDLVLFNISNTTFFSQEFFAINTHETFWSNSINVSNLTEGNYVLQIVANDSANNINNTVTLNFTIDRSSPTISLFIPTNGSDIGVGDSNSSTQISYFVYDSYSIVSSCNFYLNGLLNRTDIISNQSKNVSFNLNLVLGDYNWSVTCNDSNNYSTSSNLNQFNIYSVVPNITNVTQEVSQSSAIIIWQTSSLTNSSVMFGATISLGDNVSNNSFVNNHSVLLSGLSSSTTYYYNITSCNQFSDCNVSSNHSFTTESATPPLTNTGRSGGGGGGGGGSSTITTITSEDVVEVQEETEELKESENQESVESDEAILKSEKENSLVGQGIKIPFISKLGKSSFSKEVSVKKDEPISIKIEDEKIAVEEIVLTLDEDVEIIVNVESVKSVPEEIEKVSGSYQYLDIKPEGLDENEDLIKGASFTFVVEKGWLESNGYARENVEALRYNEGWQVLETELIEDENGDLVFQSFTPGFSYFVIRSSKNSTSGIIIALGLIIVAILLILDLIWEYKKHHKFRLGFN